MQKMLYLPKAPGESVFFDGEIDHNSCATNAFSDSECTAARASSFLSAVRNLVLQHMGLSTSLALGHSRWR
jgi:hypothetical protein